MGIEQLTFRRLGGIAFAPLAGTPDISFGTLVWQLGQATMVSVIIKATFSLESSPMRITQPLPLYALDVVDAKRRVLVAPADLVPRRRRIDVVAVAPGPGSSAGASEALVRMAALDTDGRGLLDIAKRVPPGRPVGFEALRVDPAPHTLLVNESGMAVMKLRHDIPFALFQSAPPEQQLDALPNDATLVLQGVHPFHARIQGKLPLPTPVAVAFGVHRTAATTLRFRTDTVVLDADALLCSMVWRAELSIKSPARVADITVCGGLSLGGAELDLPSSVDALPPVEPLPPQGQLLHAIPQSGTSKGGLDATMAINAEAVAAALPFAKKRDTVDPFTTQPDTKPVTKMTLPFDKSAKVVLPGVGAPMSQADKGSTLPISSVGGSTLPFDKKDEGPTIAEQLAAREAADKANKSKAAAAEANREAAAAERARKKREARVAAEREKFALEQRQAEERQKRKRAEAMQKANKKAAELSDALYGGFRKD